MSSYTLKDSDTVPEGDPYEKFMKLWNQTTKDDWRYMKLHPKHAIDIWNSYMLAGEKGLAFFSRVMCEEAGSPCDAFRHCYGAALPARVIGLNNARQFLRGHEVKPIKDEEEK